MEMDVVFVIFSCHYHDRRYVDVGEKSKRSMLEGFASDMILIVTINQFVELNMNFRETPIRRTEGIKSVCMSLKSFLVDESMRGQEI